jgi:hypothetical protein
MGGKGGAPAAPDYSALALSSIQASQTQAQTSKDQLDWAKQQYADQAPMTKAFMQSMVDTQAQDRTIQQQQMDIAQQQEANAQKAQAYYEKTYQPMETAFAQEAQNWNTPARAGERSAAAQADVASTFAGQRSAALQSLEGYGIDPSQTRYGALDLGARISQAAAQAAAGTTSRQQTEATGLALQGEAINIGRGYPGQVAGAYGTAINAGQAGVGAGQGSTGAGSAGVSAGLNTSNTYGNLMGTPTQWSGLSNQSLGLGANIMNTGFQNQMAGFNANASIAQNTASGVGGLMGAGIVGGAIII